MKLYKKDIPNWQKRMMRDMTETAPYIWKCISLYSGDVIIPEICKWANGLGFGNVATQIDNSHIKVVDPLCRMLENLGILKSNF